MICISPIGEFTPELLQALTAALKAPFGLRCGVRALVEDLKFAFDAQRNQYHATAILERLEARAPAGCLKVVGLTQVDLFIPILTYVFGEAQLGGKASLVSTHRMKEPGSRPGNPVPFEQRIVKEVVHELGHTFKLRHCPEARCIMHYARCIDDVDRKGEHFCRHCRVLLADEMERLGRAKEMPQALKERSNPQKPAG